MVYELYFETRSKSIFKILKLKPLLSLLIVGNFLRHLTNDAGTVGVKSLYEMLNRGFRSGLHINPLWM
jgi:hypothetical protein